MGRLKDYRSPSTKNRSRVRLIIYLSKVIKIARHMICATDTMENEVKSDNSNIDDTRNQLVKSSFLTSTPKPNKIDCKKLLDIVCKGCKKKCHENKHLKVHQMVHTWDPPDISCIDIPD